MMRLFRLSAADAADPVKLKSFEDSMNEIEAEAMDADLLVQASVQVAPDGAMIGTVGYATMDLQTRTMRSARKSEVEKKLARARRAGPAGS